MAGHEATLFASSGCSRNGRPSSASSGSEEGRGTDRRGGEGCRKAKEARRKDEEQCSNLLEMVLEHAVNEDVPDLLDKLLPVVPEGDFWRVSNCLQISRLEAVS